MERRVAYHNGRWAPLDETSMALDDWGLLQGATLVERMRTVAGRPLDAAEHLDRLRSSAKVLGIHWPESLNDSLVEQCVARNESAHRGVDGRSRDFGVVVLLTPGRAGAAPAGHQPTVMAHTADLHWSALAHWYQHGQALVTASNRNVPGACWSPHLKTRSRMHYFLADQQAAASGRAHAGAAMLSLEGHLTESSVANILVVDHHGLISPPIDSVLHGLSLRRTLRLAHRLNIPVRFEPIAISVARSAQAIIMTGSSGCLWPASHLDEIEFSSPSSHDLFTTLRDAWIEDIQLDFPAQAIEEAKY